jgi:hypothetical protein
MLFVLPGTMANPAFAAWQTPLSISNPPRVSFTLDLE